MRIRLQLAYDGSSYLGWQKQPGGQTVQDQLESALAKLFQENIKTIGSGRTDTGVHAYDQNVHFDIDRDLKNKDLRHMINSQLSGDIVVQKAFLAPDHFHALSSAESKIYEYRVLQTEVPCPIRKNRSWWHKKLEVEKLNTLSEVFLGKHDFKSFQSKGTDVPDTIREIHKSEWQKDHDELVYTVEGNGFLKQMVRNLVGTMIHALVKSDEPVKYLQNVLEAQDRQKAAAPAPAEGLYLKRVIYKDGIEPDCRELPLV